MQLHLKTKLILLSCCLFIFSAVSAAADETAETANLFIHTNPINATVFFDGEPLLQQTPALLKNIKSGGHSISIRKEGFSPVYNEINLDPGKTEVYESILSRGTFIADFPDEDKITLKTDKNTVLPTALRFPEGAYQFVIGNEGLNIIPVYPKESLLSITGTLFLTALTANLVSTAVELNSKGELFLPHSGHLIITEAVTAVLGLSELALLIDRRRFAEDFELFGMDLSSLDIEAEQIFNRAQKSLSTGRLEDALTGFSLLVSNFPDYTGFPEALYKIAKIHIITGDTNLAVSELNIIIKNFPDAGIYDKSCQTLALLYFNSGNPEKSRYAVEQMVYYDPLFQGTKEDIDRIGIDSVIRNWAGNPEGQSQ